MSFDLYQMTQHLIKSQPLPPPLEIQAFATSQPQRVPQRFHLRRHIGIHGHRPPYSRWVSPGHLFVASSLLLLPRPLTGEAKSR